MLSTSSLSSKSSQRFLRISAIHHNMTHFISESTVHEYQYSIEHFPETSSLMTSGYGTNYDFSICSRSPHSSLSLKELQTLFPDVTDTHGSPCQILNKLIQLHSGGMCPFLGSSSLMTSIRESHYLVPRGMWGPTSCTNGASFTS